MIDIVVAMESVVETAITLDACRRPGDPAAAQSVAAAALALAFPALRKSPSAATDMLTRLRADPADSAGVLNCTVGAILIWRAVDRAERTGDSPLEAAETGLRTALAYVALVPDEQFATLGVDQPRRHAELAILEVQARLALSRSVEETA